MSTSMRSVVCGLALAATAQASASATNGQSASAANPIRKVVTMLQNIEKKVTKEAEAEQALFDKYMCYCKSGSGELEQSISAADNKVPQVGSAIEEAEAMKVQLDSDLKSHQADRAAAKAAMESATSIREKEAKAFAALKEEADSNIAAIAKAVKSLEAGMAGSFLQTKQASLLRNLFQTQAEVSDADRNDVLSFLAGGNGYIPQSGQITGILKQLGDEMSKSLADATMDENAAIKSFEGLMAAKTKEVNVLTTAIESKTIRSGETAVQIVQLKHDLSSTQAALLDDKKFLADMEKDCAQKEADWAEISKTRSEELAALAETIKLLNDDDALELFKKTLPSASASLVQVDSHSASQRKRALVLLQAARGQASKPLRPGLDFISLALQGKKIGFEKVIGMIDEMVETLKTEQKDDDAKKDYCDKQFDETDDKKKGLEQAISDAEKAAEDAEEGIATLASEIKALQEGIEALDKSVAEATEQRQKEHGEFTELMSMNTAAVDLINMAKNRLNKFYNKALYVPPPKRELSEEDRIAVNMGGTAPPTPAPGGIAGTGITAFFEEAPAPPPAAPKAFEKAEETTGVISMMDLLVKDLTAEMQEAETAEKDAQADYEQMAADAASKRGADASSITEKEATKASTEEALQAQKDAKASATKELLGTLEYIQSLHGECDWLVENFAARKEARTSEIEALGNAKAVLSGADFALIQTKTKARSLRGNM